MNRREYLVGAGGVASSMLLAGCSSEEESNRQDGDANNGGGSGGGNGDANQDTTQSGKSVEILNHEWYEEDFSSGVRGTIENLTDNELSYVEVKAYFLDSEGTQIGEGLDNFSDLAGGRKAEFECVFLGDDASRVDSYEIETSVTNL
jgi:dipeptidyl aminopeptidase/acylaminoacyl peptidase